MKLAIMQPYFIPYLGYFQLIRHVDKFVLYDDVNYIKRGWINRNRILVANSSQFLSIPLQKVSQNKKINQHFLSEEHQWKRKMLNSITHAYRKAPKFDEAYNLMEKIVLYEKGNLASFVLNSIKNFCDYLNIGTLIVDSSVDYKNSHLKGMDRILDICTQEKCSEYVNPIGGVDLYNKDIFENRRIKLSFIQSGDLSYNQWKGKLFVPYLSVLDVIMFNDIKEIDSLMEDFIII